MRSKWAGALMSLTVAYFAYHAFAGEQGLGNWTDMQSKLHAKEAELAELQAQNAALQKDITRLTPGHVDPDMVEVLARYKLGFVYADEYILVDADTGHAKSHK